MKISNHFDVRDFVPKEVYAKFGEQSSWFVSHSIVKMADATFEFFDAWCRKQYPNVKSVKMVINDWASGGSFNHRGLRTYEYIKSQIDAGVKTATQSQHIGGSTNAIDFNIIITFNDGKTLTLDSNLVRRVILENAKYFMDAGLTTLEDGAYAPGWCHADCRWTGLDHIFIVKP